MTTIALRARGLSKTFAGRRVLDSVDLDVRAGEVVGLVGQNGCGKSTFIKIISGVYTPDSGGHLEVIERPVDLPVAAGAAAQAGLVFVHQDLGLFLDGSVLENVRLGRYRTGFAGRIDWRRERAACRDSLARVGLDVDPDRQVGTLSQVDRALVAIARAVDQAQDTSSGGHGGVIVLDEPTSYLPRDGVDRLFDAVRELRSQGMGVLFVSHRINEILELCDSIAVLRDGRLVDRFDAATATEDVVVEAMLGRRLEQYFPDHDAAVQPGEVVLEVERLSGEGVHDVSFDVRRGEIYGVTGVLGMGQERLLYLLNGANASTGRVRCAGTELDARALTPRRARDRGIALLPADRVRTSGVQQATVLENITLATLGLYTRRGRIRHAEERAAAQRLVEQYDVRPPDVDRQMRTLSGGNQQKALLAKWMNAEPLVLLLHEPTQGVDIGAKQQIFALLRAAADSGLSVVIATTEYEDLAGLCDRVMVMRDGRRAVELGGDALTHERLVEECYRTGETAA
jgi:ribose transport system ATP-binding protein